MPQMTVFFIMSTYNTRTNIHFRLDKNCAGSFQPKDTPLPDSSHSGAITQNEAWKLTFSPIYIVPLYTVLLSCQDLLRVSAVSTYPLILIIFEVSKNLELL